MNEVQKPARVLIVDDDDRNRRLLEAMLEAEGYVVLAAADGKRALDLVRQNPPEIILLDVMMPDMDGYEVARVLKGHELTRAIPVVMITALDDRESRLRGLEAGAEEFVNKPVDRGELSIRVRNLVRLKRIGDLLASREQELRAVLDNLLDAVIQIDTRGIVRAANPAVLRVLGYTPEELIGHNVKRLMPQPDRGEHDGYIERHRRTGEARVIGVGREVTGLHKDGHLVFLEIAISEYTLRGEHYYLGILRDISERKRIMTDLAQARDAAELANRAKSVFLATMSHEIRTPMNGVLGMVELLFHERLSGDQSDMVSTIRHSATSLLGIIDDILDFSKIEAGQLEITLTPLSVAELAEGVCNTLLPDALRRGVDLALFVSPEIPETVLADEVRLRQVLYNLVGNALKFSGNQTAKRGRVSIRAEVVQAVPLKLDFRITDNGIGMAPEALAKLFMPFTQAEASTTRRFGGTGLGLAICKRLVTLMHGEITVTSTPGLGSTFSVTAPFEVPDDQPASSMPDLSGLNCIVVESPDLDADDLCSYLDHAGARVTMVADARAASDAVSHLANPVVIIADAGRERPSVEKLHATRDALPNRSQLLMTWGQRRHCRVEALKVVTLDRDALRRQIFLNAVLVAAGRVAPQKSTPTTGNALSCQMPPPSVAEARAQGQLILVAEDDAINQKVIVRQLALLGYAAEVASTGTEALRLWRKGNYGLLLTDLHMPEMDGYALADSIRREEAGQQRLPIVALTANALRGEANRARAIGVDDYLTKPVQLRTLQSALARWLPPRNEGTAHAAAPIANCVAEATTVLHVSVLKDLVGDDAHTIREFLSDYLESARSQVTELRAAIAAGNTPQLGAIVHKLKSSSRAVGALTLGDLCAELEGACKAEEQARIFQLMPRFEALFAQVTERVAWELAQER